MRAPDAAATPPSPPRPRATVIYDAGCGLCRCALALLLAADRRGALEPLALGTARADELLADLSEQQRWASWHVIDPAGRRTSAGAALVAALEQLAGGRLAAALLRRAPDLSERGYRWVAAHRSSLSRAVPAWARRRTDAAILRRTSPAAAGPQPAPAVKPGGAPGARCGRPGARCGWPSARCG